METNKEREDYIQYLKDNNISDKNIKRILSIEDKKAKEGLFCYDKKLASLLYMYEFGTIEIN